jgi:aryl-alcohol dehydrogenase-like predicted oxidoreductase
MEYRNLGRTGLKVSEICLGTMTFGLYTDEAEADRMLGLTIDAGVNFIDTANAYIGGKSETILGNILGKRREDLILATKFFNPMGPGPNDSGWSRSHLMKSVEASLKRLKTDYIDIFYIHHVDVQTPIEETLRALNDLVSQGKIGYLACSNFESWRLMDALWISDHHDWSPLPIQRRRSRRMGSVGRRLPDGQIPTRFKQESGRHPLSRRVVFPRSFLCQKLRRHFDHPTGGL